MATVKGADVTAKKATIYDIATRANVSTTTVHKALHNRKGVGDKMRQRIQDIARELNYIRNPAAHILSRRELHIGVVIEVHNREIGSALINGVRHAIEQLRDHKVVGHFGRLENNLSRTRVLGDFEKMLESDMDGIVLIPTTPYPELADFNPRIKELGIPVVTASNSLPHLDTLSAVLQNGRMLGHMAGSLMNLCNPGSANAVFIGSKDVFVQADSMNCFAETLRAHGGDLVMAYETQVDNRISYAQTESLVANYPDVTGIFVGVSQCLGVINRLKEMKLIDKFKIITVDTYPEIMEHLKNGAIAASLDRRPFKMGQTAIHVLYQYLVNGVQPERHIYISPSVVLPATADEYVQDDTGPLVDIVL